MINLKNPFSLIGKKILITGASSGIGRTTAIECSKLGAKLVLTGRNVENLLQTMSMLSGDEHIFKILNQNDIEAVSKFIIDIPNLDGIVFCAGIQKTSPIKFIQRTDIEEIFETNFFSNVNLNSQLMIKKKLNKGASLVFISSITAGIIALNGNAIYSASKGALTSFAKVLALELSVQKIRVNCILPAMVRTPLLENIFIEKEQLDEDEKRYPFGYGNPEDVAYAAIYLLSEGSKWITGTNLIMDGGLTLK